MTKATTQHRSALRNLARCGALISALMVVISVSAAVGPASLTSAAGVNAGAVTVTVGTGPTAGQPLASGGSATEFALTLPVGAACTGDSVTGGYRVQSFMVPANVDLGTLTFGLTGPVPTATGAQFRQPLYSTTGSGWSNKTTAVNTGLIISPPVISFAWVDSGGVAVLPAGTYNVGFACTRNAGTELDRYWSAQLTVSEAPTDLPSGLTWVVATVTENTTTTMTSTTTTVVGATTTTVAGATTTTVRTGSTTSSSTTSTTALGGVTTTTGFAVNTTAFGSGAGTGNRTIVATGSSPIPVVVWGLLLLVFGRMALLLGRPLRVLPPKTR